jgi:hypothetical protein
MTATPTGRIVPEDMTTPAHERLRPTAHGPAPSGPRSAATREDVASTPPGRATSPANLTFLAGVWLVIAGISLNYHETGLFDAYWSDVVVGIALAVVALVCIVKPVAASSLTLTRVALGGWLIAAPFVLSYGDVPKPTWNDIVVGAVVISLAVAGTGLLRGSGDSADR